MLTREQHFAFACMKKLRVTLFSALPRDVIRYMGEASAAAFNTNSDIAKLLGHITYGNLQSVQAMLEINPRLVLQAGNVQTPSGLNVIHTTPLECALGAGDPEMAKMIARYFDSDKITGGAEVRERQYARYRPHLENILKQKPYNFTLLMATLKKASQQDVAAVLNGDMTHTSTLRDVLQQFRKDFTPDKIGVGMHFNYRHLLRAYEVYDQEYNQLRVGGSYDRNHLFCRQVIGFIQRSLPAIDRMVYAQSIYDVVGMKVEIERSFKFKFSDLDFPVTARDNSAHSGLGFQYFVGRGRWQWMEPSGWTSRFLDTFCRSKISSLLNLCRRLEQKNVSTCRR